MEYFVIEFLDYIEKLSCLRGNLIIVGDFNINWLVIVTVNVGTYLTFWIHSVVGKRARLGNFERAG